jgi:hypothetical protein
MIECNQKYNDDHRKAIEEYNDGLRLWQQKHGPTLSSLLAEKEFWELVWQMESSRRGEFSRRGRRSPFDPPAGLRPREEIELVPPPFSLPLWPSDIPPTYWEPGDVSP